MIAQKFSVTVKNKKFGVEISGPEEKYGEKIYRIMGDGWDFDAEMSAEDLSDFLASGNIPYLIEQELKEKSQPTTRFAFRLTSGERKILERRAYEGGFKSLSDFARERLLAV